MTPLLLCALGSDYSRRYSGDSAQTSRYSSAAATKRHSGVFSSYGGSYGGDTAAAAAARRNFGSDSLTFSRTTSPTKFSLGALK